MNLKISNFALKWVLEKPRSGYSAGELHFVYNAELSTGRMDPRVGSGRVTILPDFGGSG